jgi:hypothetical protein
MNFFFNLCEKVFGFFLGDIGSWPKKNLGDPISARKFLRDKKKIWTF